jgi:hypothetical protein
VTFSFCLLNLVSCLITWDLIVVIVVVTPLGLHYWFIFTYLQRFSLTPFCLFIPPKCPTTHYVIFCLGVPSLVELLYTTWVENTVHEVPSDLQKWKRLCDDSWYYVLLLSGVGFSGLEYGFVA